MLTKNDLYQIKTVVQETIKPEIKALGTEIKTLKQSMSTKDDMKTLESGLKGDMQNLESRLKGDMKTLESGLKGDMKTLEVRLTERIEEAQMEIIETVDKHKADKESVKVLGKRVERLEDNADLPPYIDQ